MCTVGSVVHLFLDQRCNPEDNDCTDDGCAELTKDAAPRNAEHVKQPATEDSTKETKHHIHDETETATFHQLAGTEASQTSYKKRKNICFMGAKLRQKSLPTVIRIDGIITKFIFFRL